MKTILIAFLFLANVSAQANLTSKMPSSYPETGIPNSHALSENVIRGMAPKSEKDLKRLLELGVEKFLMFKIDTNGDVAKEIEKLKALSVPEKNLLNLPFPWKDITDFKPICEMTVEALNMIKDAEENNEKIFFHCTVGEDRTGYLAGLYRIYRQDNMTVDEIFENEMCDRGYEAGNPKKIFSVASKVRQSLTPAFFTMINIIEKAEKAKKRLTKSMCKNVEMVEVDLKVYKCKKSKLL
jgi:protein-tyrosine phosphatase